MLKIESKNAILYPLAIVINLILPFLVFASFKPGHFNMYFNSDTLYLASIYKDIFVDGTGFSGWNLNGAPNFFPDMLLYFVIRPFFTDFKIAYVVFSVVQYNLILFLMGALFRSINPKIEKIYPILFYLVFPVFLLATIFHDSFQYTFHLFSQAYHNGCFINVLVSLNLFFIYLRNPKKLTLAGLILFGLLGSFNDRLYLVIFMVPVLMMYILNFFRIKLKSLRIAGLSVILASLAGYLIFNATKSNPIYKCISLGGKFMNLGNAGSSLKAFLDQHIDFVMRHDLRGFVTVLMVLSLFLMAFWLVKVVVGSKGLKNIAHVNKIEFIFTAVILMSVLITLSTPVVNGYYMGPACIRYITFAHFISIFTDVFMLYQLNVKFKKTAIWVLIVFFAILNTGTIVYVFVNKPVISNIKKVTEYYPEKVKNLDAFGQKHNLKYGVAEYWDAKLSTMLSKNDMRVYTIINNKLHVWYHVMNSNWYYPYDKGTYNNPVFNFVILNTTDFQTTRQLFGEPMDSAKFDGNTYIYYIQEFRFNRETKQPYNCSNLERGME